MPEMGTRDGKGEGHAIVLSIQDGMGREYNLSQTALTSPLTCPMSISTRQGCLLILAA